MFEDGLIRSSSRSLLDSEITNDADWKEYLPTIGRWNIFHTHLCDIWSHALGSRVLFETSCQILAFHFLTNYLFREIFYFKYLLKHSSINICKLLIRIVTFLDLSRSSYFFQHEFRTKNKKWNNVLLLYFDIAWKLPHQLWV